MNPLEGTGSLVRLAIRRDRILLPVAIAAFVSMVTFSATATTDLYPSASSRIQAAATINTTTALVALYGRIYGPSLGALSLIKMGGLGVVALAILAFTLVVRHTRAEEEAGRLELIGAAAVGRFAPLSAAVSVAVATSLVIGILSTLGLAAAGLPANGSLAFGLAWAATGCAFAAVGALSAQLTAGGRTASGIAAAFLGLTYLVRAVGDTTGHGAAGPISWLSPIGWSQQVRPFAQERLPVLLLLVVFAVAVGAAAYVLAGRRDLGAGLLADRPGPAVAGSRLSTPIGLAWRLQRATLLAWMATIALAAAIVGSIAANVGGIADNPQARDFITKLGGVHALTDAYLALELGAFGAVVSIFGMQAAMRLRSEEVAWRTDLTLSTATGRVRWLASHLTLAVAGTCGLLVLGGVFSGIGYAAAVGDAGVIGRVVAGGAVQIPAALVMIGIVVAIFGIAPRLTSATWGVLIAFLLLGEFGSLFNLPQWIMDLSPFAHVPRIPGGTMQVAPLVWLSAIAILLIGVGIAGFRRRDVG